MKPTDGTYQEAVIPTRNGNVWFRAIGDLRANIPLLVLHGGPGMPHDYLANLSALAGDRAVIFYDQLGCGRSSSAANPASYTVEYFVDEIDIVRKHIGIEHLHLFGHSWGGWLAIEYALRDASGLQSLILANTPPSVPAFMRDIPGLVADLPWRHRRQLRKYPIGISNKHFAKAYQTFLERHLCTLQPWPSELMAAWRNAGTDVYRTLWGETELECMGSLRDWDCTDRLSELTMPVLLTAGAHDEVRPSQVQVATEAIPNNKFVVFEHSAHFPHLEEPEQFKSVISEWLTDHDE